MTTYTNYTYKVLLVIQPGDQVSTGEEVAILLSRKLSDSRIFKTEMKWLLPTGKVFKVDYDLGF